MAGDCGEAFWTGIAIGTAAGVGIAAVIAIVVEDIAARIKRRLYDRDIRREIETG
jgi:hypothetical protein